MKNETNCDFNTRIRCSLRVSMFLLFFTYFTSSLLYAQQDIKISTANSELLLGESVFDIGEVMLDYPVAYHFIIENSGDANLTLDAAKAVVLSGDNPESFYVESDVNGLELVPGQIEVFDVTMDASTIGDKSVVVAVNSDAPDESIFTFTITATSVAKPGACTILSEGFESYYTSSFPKLNALSFSTIGVSEYETAPGWSPLAGFAMVLLGLDFNLNITADSHSGNGALELVGEGSDVFSIFPCSKDKKATLKGYYKFEGAPSDSAVVVVSTGGGVNENRDITNTDSLIINTNAESYTMFELDFEYADTSVDSLIVWLYATNNSNSVNFKVDDLEIVFNTDVFPPVVESFSPMVGEKGVDPNTELTLTFDREMSKGIGNIYIKKSADSTPIETIDVSSSNVVVDGLTVVITPFSSLPEGTGIFVSIDNGAFEDSESESYEGIAHDSVWSFTTKEFVNPIVVVKDIAIKLGEEGNVSLSSNQIDDGSADNLTAQEDLILSLDITEFDCTDLGENTVVLTVADESGNSATATATVTVEDNIYPKAIAKDVKVSLDENGRVPVSAASIDNGSSDNCSFTRGIDITAFDCTDLGENDVVLTIIDESGNSATATATVTVEDNANPTAIAKDIKVSLDANGRASINAEAIDNGSSDNCSFTRSVDVTEFGCADLGESDVVLTVTDESGNSATATAKVTVEDQIAPVAMSKDINLILDENGIATIKPEDVDDNSIDNCSFDLSLDIERFDESNLGENVVILTATDKSGNSTSATANVIVNSRQITSIDESVEIKVNVYPNPTSGMLNLELFNLQNAEYSMRIYSITGTKILDLFGGKLSGDVKKSFTLDHLNPGIYMLLISGEKKHHIRSLVIE